MVPTSFSPTLAVIYAEHPVELIDYVFELIYNSKLVLSVVLLAASHMCEYKNIV